MSVQQRLSSRTTADADPQIAGKWVEHCAPSSKVPKIHHYVRTKVDDPSKPAHRCHRIALQTWSMQPTEFPLVLMGIGASRSVRLQLCKP